MRPLGRHDEDLRPEERCRMDYLRHRNINGTTGRLTAPCDVSKELYT